MPRPSTRTRAQIVATLAALQTGIEPATLTLLVANHAVQPADFGWIVSAGQIGMTGGALLGWQAEPRRTLLLAGPAIGVGACLALPLAHGLLAVLAVRIVLGVIMGFALTRATAIAARERPHNAIGVIYLAQPLLSTALLAGLPLAAVAWGPAAALGLLTGIPLVIALLLRVDDGAVAPPCRDAVAPDAAGNALIPMALIIAVTMMLWSYITTVGAAVGLRGDEVSAAIALGSLTSAPAALLAAGSLPRCPPWLTALVCGAALLSPWLVSVDAGRTGYLVALAAFNAGSTFGAIRFTAWAMRAPLRHRQFVALVQCAAMSAGPALGALAMRVGGSAGLGALAAVGLVAAVLLSVIRKIEPARQPLLDVALTV